ncbi:hypothetical protein C8F01DRAFT_1260314 [Mycena amicta]|nr:hypothetical protein C8F01DRAFT_1260314 [Mycena amicta]
MPHNGTPCIPTLNNPNAVSPDLQDSDPSLPYYCVFKGRNPALILPSTAANDQVVGHSGAYMERAPTLKEARKLWGRLCREHHSLGFVVAGVVTEPITYDTLEEAQAAAMRFIHPVRAGYCGQ